MLAGDLITDEIPPLKATDTVEMALDWMEQFKVSHLPVVNNRQLIGIISETDVLDYDKPDEKINVSKIRFSQAAVHHYQHAYDVIHLMSAMNLTVIPVIDEEEMYKGCVTLKGIIHNLGNMMSVQNPGGVIVLELNQNDYSIMQIGSIIEGNDAKILSLHVSSPPESTKLEVTIKVNRQDLSAIIQTFNRYNYSIKASFHHGSFDKDMRDRLDQFMHFLNI